MSELSKSIERRWSAESYPISEVPKLVRDMEHLCDEIDRIEAERDRQLDYNKQLIEQLENKKFEVDRLKFDLNSMRDAWDMQYAEINRLKAEVETLSCPICGSDINGTNWKAKAETFEEMYQGKNKQAEKLAGALRELKANTRPPLPINQEWVYNLAKSALEEMK